MARHGINKVILVGHLGQDPKMHDTQSRQTVATISLATSESWQDKQTQQKQERTEWHRVVFFGRLAEIAGLYLKKGSQIYIEGKLQTRKWHDQQGQDYTMTEIIVDDYNGVMQMLSSPQTQQTSAHNTQHSAPQQGAQQVPQARQRHNQQNWNPDPFDNPAF